VSIDTVTGVSADGSVILRNKNMKAQRSFETSVTIFTSGQWASSWKPWFLSDIAVITSCRPHD